MTENYRTGIASLGLILCFEAVWQSENCTQELLVWVSYCPLKLYGMPENSTTVIASLGLILCFETVQHARELQHRNG
jgi:hypothetical protein